MEIYYKKKFKGTKSKIFSSTKLYEYDKITCSNIQIIIWNYVIWYNSLCQTLFGNRYLLNVPNPHMYINSTYTVNYIQYTVLHIEEQNFILKSILSVKIRIILLK